LIRFNSYFMSLYS